MTGKFYFPAHTDADHKRHVAFELALLISNHLIKGGKFEDVYFALQHFMQENKKYREEEDVDVKEQNTLMEFIHNVIAKDLENEQKKRVKQDVLSEEERSIVIKWGLEREKRKAEISYWLRIGGLMAGGLTQEEAREKIYQDVLHRGDPKIITMFREFQNKIHPIKTNDQLPPPPPPIQPPSPT
jgi:hypothetical protein